MNNKKKYLILGIFGIIFMFFGGTLSYWQWESSTSEQTKVTFTVASDFSCSVDGGGDITSSDVMLAPASCTNSKYAIQRTIKVNPTITNNNTNVSMDLWLDVENIDTNLLASDNFKYALTKSSTSCIDNIVQYGTIKDNIVNNKLELLNEKVYSQTYTNTYYLYIWLDKKETNPNTMNQTFNISLNGNCTNMDKGDPFYVVYSEPNNSLRFYKPIEGTITEGEEYNGEIATKVYKAYENDIYNSSSKVPWYEVRDNITTIKIEDEISPISTSAWFNNFLNVSNIDVTKLNTSNTISMYGMFNKVGCSENIKKFTITGLNNFDTSNVTDMRMMFQNAGCNATEWDIGDLSKKTVIKENGNTYTAWDTSNVINMRTMFNGSGTNVEVYDIGNLDNWNVSNVKEMTAMFQNIGRNSKSFTIGDISNWNTSNVINFGHMFSNSGYSSETLYDIGNLNNWNTSNAVSMKIMFADSGRNSSTWNIGNLSNWDTSNVISMDQMFQNAGKSATTWNIGDLSNWDTSNVTNMTYMFGGSGYNSTTWNIGDLSNWNTSQVTDMSYMFQNAGYSSTIFDIGNISSWNTSKVANMIEMFNGTGFNSSTWSLNLSNWNVDNVERYINFNLENESKVTPPNWVKEDLGYPEKETTE